MYRVVSLRAENLFTFKQLEYFVNSGMTTLINGENRDNASQESNGSGKSGLIEGFAIGLTGGPLRKVKLDEIINDDAEEAVVSIELENSALDETLIITRKFFRKSSSIVQLQILKGGKPVEDSLEETLSSVDEYNKFILNRIGLTKDEIFNQFILSKHRYENFLDISDTKKKATINQFSKGNVVDQAIGFLREDIVPLEKDVEEAKEAVEYASGKVDVLGEQLSEAEASKDQKKLALQEQIESIKDKISQKKKSIRSKKEEIDEIKEDTAYLKHEPLKDLKGYLKDQGEDSYDDQIKFLIDTVEECELDYNCSSFKSGLDKIYKSAHEYSDKIDEISEKIVNLESELKDLEDEALEAQKSSDADKDKVDKKVSKLQTAIDDLDRVIVNLKEQAKELKRKQRDLNDSKEDLRVKLAGKVACPKCNHEFIVGEEDFNVKEGAKEYKKLDKDIKLAAEDYDKIISEGKQVRADIEAKEHKQTVIRTKHRETCDVIRELNHKSEDLQIKIKSYHVDIDSCKAKLKAVDVTIENYISECFNKIINNIKSDIKENEDDISDLTVKIKFDEGGIESLSQRLKDLKDSDGEDNIQAIKDKLKDVKKEKKRLVDDLETRAEKLNVYLQQEQYFIDFKTTLANSKIEDLQSVTNDFLESIGSDLRLELSGFKKLKNGKIREKITATILRDGIVAGSYAKFSGGERARVALANILALSKLVNINCDEGKGLDLLILDEIIEAVDGSGISNMLRTLNETGITCLVISHGLVEESYPHVQKVIKEDGESTIENC